MWVGGDGGGDCRSQLGHNSPSLTYSTPLTVSPGPASSCMTCVKHPSKHPLHSTRPRLSAPVPETPVGALRHMVPPTRHRSGSHLSPPACSLQSPRDYLGALALAGLGRLLRHLAPRAPPRITHLSQQLIPVLHYSRSRSASGNRAPGPNGNLGETPTLAPPNGKNLLFEREECASNGKNLRCCYIFAARAHAARCAARAARRVRRAPHDHDTADCPR
jgi:hypothetical protein